MKLLTKFFDEDVKLTVIDRSSQRSAARPKIRRKVVVLAKVESDIKQEYKEGLSETIGFYTQFTMYRSKSQYILQISGVSTNEQLYPRRNKIIEFEEPEDLFTIICDKKDRVLYWSPLTEKLVDGILESEYLTEFEKRRWELAAIEDE